MVKDGLVLDPVRHRYILEQLNVANYPFPLSRPRAAGQRSRTGCSPSTRARHGITFVDVAGQLPFDPDLFLDAVHTSYAGTRMQAWITLNALIPLIEKHLADKSWPRPMPEPQPPLPTFTPRQITLDCKASLSAFPAGRV